MNKFTAVLDEIIQPDISGSFLLGNVIAAVISGLEGGAAIVGSTLTASINGLEGGEVVAGPEWLLDGVSVSTSASYVVPDSVGTSLRLSYTVDGIERGRIVTIAPLIVAPTISLSPVSASILVGTTGTLATITADNGGDPNATITVDGTALVVNGTSLDLIDAAVLADDDTFTVTHTNVKGSATVTFDLVVNEAGEWVFTDNGDGTFDFTTAGTIPAFTLIDNGDGTFQRTA